MSENSVRIYGHMLSQPTRVVVAFCIMNNIPYEFHEINTLNGDNRTPEFTRINPVQKIPAIVHGDFSLAESSAIAIYLAETFNAGGNMWPSDRQQRALVNQYLHWHHNNTRKGGEYIFYKFFMPKFMGKTAPPEKEEEAKNLMEKTLHFINEILASGKYVARTSYPTLADIVCYCELAQFKLLAFDWSKYPAIMNWMQEISKLSGVSESHEALIKFAESQ
mmetsp:Transcript_6744/g.9941  ORF Transcript_6744/g.9941 Transcript_6744/m.9941 type:complete len:220 (+) Transcript_6744:867-1526(+)